MAILLQRGNSENYVTIGTFYNLSDIVKEMNKTLAKEKVEVFYFKEYVMGDGYVYNDYGSHHDFFRYKEVPDTELEEEKPAKKIKTKKEKKK
jgi:hypothetical protein